MALTLRSLYTEDNNRFKLSLQAGANGVRNAVTWVHMLEDDTIIPFFHGSELAVTTGIRTESDPAWLGELARKLADRGAAGLIVNTGKYIREIPREVLDYCDEREFPLLTMPWEIRVTEMLQAFCTRIVQERQDSVLFDQALDDALFNRGDAEAYREILGRHYDLEGRFTVIVIQPGQGDEESKKGEEEYRFINRLRRFKTINGMQKVKFGLLLHDNYHLLVTNNVDRSRMPELLEITQDVYAEAAKAGSLFIGVGNEVTGLENLGKSFRRARTAMRIAQFKARPYVRFEDMGIYRLLFSVKDEEVLHAYARDLLGPIEGEDARSQGYIELLQAYIANDRSLERTAAQLYLHRNTVNYRLQKLKTLLGSPLKTVEDLFPYQVALAILDMERHGFADSATG